jgi:predicted amino acid racemase
MTGVIKGCASLDEVADIYLESDCHSLGSSRIQQLKRLKSHESIETMLLRLPMLDEIEDVIRYADISLNSEMTVLEALDREAILQNKVHQVILMLDVGDLREGFWHENNLLEAARYVEASEGLFLKGIGSNLSCYGSVKPTVKNMNYLVYEAEQIEKAIGRSLDIISGGATSTMPMVVKGLLPERINHLRLGESILLGRDQEVFYDCPLPLHEDTFVLTAQLIEIKNKPSLPIGE